MLEESLKQEIQAAYSRFLDSRGLRARRSQKLMIAEVANTLGSIRFDDQGKRLGETHVTAIEAGTGTGKTIAYLLGALLIARARGLKLIVSTATVALQEQLISKDLPQLAEHAALHFNYTLGKGRGRYLCLNKAEQLLDASQQRGQIALYEDELAALPDPHVLEQCRQWLDQYASGLWDGDRDRLEQVPDEEHWRHLTSDHMQCSNRRCHNFSVCPFYRARERFADADLIVANHDLVLADLSLGGGAILPDPARSIYIFDEGHHLADKAGNHFSYSMRLRSAQKLLAITEKKLQQFAALVGSPLVDELLGRIQHLSGELLHALDLWLELVQQLDFEENGPHQSRHRFVGGRVPDAWLTPARETAHCCARLEALLEQFTDLLREALENSGGDIPRSLAEQIYPQLGVFWGRIQQLNWLADSYARPDAEGKTPTARWVTLHEGVGGRDYECSSSPVSVAATLREHLWSACYGAVVTSATLTALGSFKRIQTALGLPFEGRTLQLSSPFDYAQVASLEVPAMQHDPVQTDAHTREVSDFLNRRLPDSRATLVLFSSWRQMRAVLEQLQESVKNRVLAQGMYGKSEILRLHCQRIDAGDVSVIFGLASFAEGVDLPGDYLTEVIIARIPFSVPDDPVDATMAEWIEQRGGNAFIEWTIPSASVRLTQAVGRLLRTEADSGRVVILDRRLLSKRYGRQLLDALPPFRRL